MIGQSRGAARENPTGQTAEPCYVCGGPEHKPGSHTYWSTADANAEIAAEDARLSRPGYVEARYVAEYRPY